MSENEIISWESRIMLMQLCETEVGAFKTKAEEIKDSIKEQMTAARTGEPVATDFAVRFADVLTSRFETKLFKETCVENLYNRFLEQVAYKRFTVT